MAKQRRESRPSNEFARMLQNKGGRQLRGKKEKSLARPGKGTTEKHKTQGNDITKDPSRNKAVRADKVKPGL